MTKTATHPGRGMINEIVSAAMLGIIFFGLSFSFTYANESLMQGMIDGQNTFFQISDSSYLPITLNSSEPISLRLESAPNIVTLAIDAATSSLETTISMGGFFPLTTYYKYSDTYHNLIQFTTDETGVYTYTQDISVPHIIFIQSHKSTKFLRDDATGGDCALIGIWDTSTKTCTLTQNLFETVQIDSDNITLDGNHFTISGFHTGSGIYMNGRSGVTIKNLEITNFSYGVSLYNSNNIHIADNILSNNDYQAIVLSNSIANTITGNTASLLVPSTSRHQGFVLYNSHNNIFQSNAIMLNARASISGGHQGILLFSSNNNTFISSSVSDTYQGILFFSSSNNIVRENTIRDNQNTGLSIFSPASGNQVYNNNFLRNPTQAVNYAGAGNVFHLPIPDGGNYWDTFDTTSEGCSDINTDGFCDAPRVFTSGQDNFPWTAQDGWKSLTNQSPVLSFAAETPQGLYEDDGIQDHKGTAGKTHFTFSVIYTDAQNRMPNTVSLIVGDGIATTTLPMHIDASATSTLHDSDYHNGETYVASSTFPKGAHQYYFETSVGTDIVRLPGTGTLTFEVGYPNVLFLPGIMGSRLYDATGKVRWLPENDTEADYVRMQSDGTSALPDITTLDAIDTADAQQLNTNIYKSFLNEMKLWEGTYGITATTTPYDLRLDYDAVINNGRKLANGRISYLLPPLTGEDPYILQTLKHLASTSPTGKVTIVGHSQGGLIAKALMQKIGATTTATLIDNVILVATPQLGTPKAVGALLNGFETGITGAISDEKSRGLAQNMQSTYNLLPSANYFTYVNDPVITISSSTLPEWSNTYDDTIHWNQGMYNFMADTAQLRTKPAYVDLNNPEIVNLSFLNRARTVHASLDDWTPPQGVQLTTIAGWGLETLSGVEYENVPKCTSSWSGGCLAYSYDFTLTPKHVIDGDGTVVEPSAQWANGATSTRWWVDLKEYNFFNPVETAFGFFGLGHADILEVPELRTLITHILTSGHSEPPTEYISGLAPAYNGTDDRLHFTLHSPLILGFMDTNGNYTGATATGTLSYIPGVYYERYGEVQWLSVPKDIAGTLVMHGTATGSFTLDIEEVNGNTILSTTSFAGIPSGTSTIVTMTIDPLRSVTASSTLAVDTDGDGTPDFTLASNQGGVVLSPKPALTVTADNKTMAIGSAIPEFSATLTGFINTDTASTSITGTPSCTTTATQGSPVGTYPITCTKGTLASNAYDITTFVAGTLTTTYRFDGFLQPINDTTYNPTQNLSVFKGGSTVPVKFQLKNVTGTPLQSTSAPLWLTPQQLSPLSTTVSELLYTDSATTGSTFRFDTASQQYIYNWSTKGLTTGYWYRLSAQLDDGTILSVVVGIR